jgi:hypothetical protein
MLADGSIISIIDVIDIAHAAISIVSSLIIHTLCIR